MAADDPLTPAERLFAEAGYTSIQYLAWRVGTLPLLKAQARARAMVSGWPASFLTEQRRETTLARRWIEQQLKSQVNESPAELTSPQRGMKAYGLPMTSREAIEVLHREVYELGKHHSIQAFEKALNRAAGRARENPDLLPVHLGGQHNDWQLVSLGAGGHGRGHVVRRQLDKDHV